MLAGVVVAMLAGSALAAPPFLERIDLVGNPATSVRLYVSAPCTPHAQALPAEGGAPDRIFLDLANIAVDPALPKRIESPGPLLLRVRVGQFDARTARVVLDLTEDAPFRVATSGRTITIELGRDDDARALRPRTPPPAAPSRGDAPSRARAAVPSPAPPSEPVGPPIPDVASGPLAPPPPTPAPQDVGPPLPPPERAPAASVPAVPAAPRAVTTRARQPQPPSSASRARPAGRFPLVVLDAGHGGRDPGAEGVGGVVEKDVVLELTLLVARRLAARLPVDVLMTRTDDSFVPIERRLASENATLFISLHANACTDPSARGLEIFYGGGALRRATSDGSGAGDWRASLLGRCLDEALQARVGGVRGPARPAGFGVLVRNPAPSALVEIGYLTHPDEAARTRDRRHQELLADAVVDGIAAFLRASAPPL